MKPESLRWLVVAQFVIAASVACGLLAPSWRPGGSSLLVLAMQGIPTTLLLLVVAIHPGHELPRYRWGIVAAFAFSLVGGFFLAKHGYFVVGVAGFFCANIAYLTAFTSGVRFAQRAVPFVILGLCGATVLVLAWPQIPGAHRLPLLLYGATIISVPAQAIVRCLATRRIGAVQAAIGATLLLISDSAIAVNLFYQRFSWAEIFIMSTYFAGQWLIATSSARAQAVSGFAITRQ